MGRRFVTTAADGTLCTIHVADGENEAAAVLQALEAIKRDHGGSVSPPRDIPQDFLPADRYFRNAWEDGGVAVQVNMVKARNVHMGYIRVVRNNELRDLDVDSLKALEEVNWQMEMQRLGQVKQRLRDIPQTLDLAPYGTSEMLKAVWPAELRSMTPIEAPEPPSGRLIRTYLFPPRRHRDQ